jgi:hypothetical protein
MQHQILFALLFSIFPFSVSLLIDVCLGFPASETFDRKAIYFDFSFFLAKQRLKRMNLFQPELPGQCETKADTFYRVMALKQNVFETGREFFSWELGFGMCPKCTNIRISILFAAAFVLIFSGAWSLVFFAPCFSNMYLLFFQKLKS